jgi:GntR family transcriptional regulator
VGSGPAERAATDAVYLRVIGVRVDYITQDISVRACLTEEATALAVPPGAPVLVVDRAHHTGERTVEAGQIVIPADRFRLSYRTSVTGPA